MESLIEEVTFIVRDFITYQNPISSRILSITKKEQKKFFRDLLTGAIASSFQSCFLQNLNCYTSNWIYKIYFGKYLIANVWMVNKLFCLNILTIF
jgi:hypothetical protein